VEYRAWHFRSRDCYRQRRTTITGALQIADPAAAGYRPRHVGSTTLRRPLSGIFSALRESKTQKNFITTCDLPLITHQLIEYIANLISEKEIVIPTINGIPQRLFGIYNKSVIEKIEEIFSLSEIDKSIKGSVYDLHQRVSLELIEIDHLPFYSENLFMNMNTPEDYKLIKNIYGKQ